MWDRPLVRHNRHRSRHQERIVLTAAISGAVIHGQVLYSVSSKIHNALKAPHVNKILLGSDNLRKLFFSDLRRYWTVSAHGQHCHSILDCSRLSCSELCNDICPSVLDYVCISRKVG